MATIIVKQIALKAMASNGEEITVSLYSGETLVGKCQTYSSYGIKETLSCDNVAADRVKLKKTSTKTTRLTVYEISVTGNYVRVLGSQIDRAPRLTVFRKGWLTFPAF